MKDLKLGALPPTRVPSSGFEMRLLCCREAGEQGLTLRYTKVTQVDVVADDGEPFVLSDYNSLRLDEILPHETGCSHELRFTTATIRIVCADLTAHWDPLPQPR
ncbi:hypothetical protein [Streptomyces sp. NPDC001380]|uniref:hypothetical protein n=1 Tax=Streptomyces sp. NPDC001380 TaxID=3364566 RepID=UPI0036B7B2FB